MISWFKRTWRRIKDFEQRNRYRGEPPDRHLPDDYIPPPPSFGP